MLTSVACDLLHGHTADTLRLGHRTILVSEQECFKPDNLLTQLRDGGSERIILSAENLDLLLEICEPLLLALATLERSNSGLMSVKSLTYT